MATARHCVVIGGGLAGLAAAIALLDAGLRVTLVEKRPFLGGRAYSFNDPETGQEVDNGQHIYLRCCTAYIDFLKRLGVFDRTALQKQFSLPVLDTQGHMSTLSAFPGLPAPLHLLPSLLAYRHLTVVEKLRLFPAFLSLFLTDRQRRRAELESQTFLQWLRQRGQPDRVIERLWNLIILPALNDDVGSVSAYMALMIFQEGLLRGRRNADIGYSRVGLTALISDAARDYIQEKGGKLLLDQAAVRLCVEQGQVTAVTLSSGQALEAEAVVSSVPWDSLLKLLDPPWVAHPFFVGAAKLEASPIVGIHVWYDRLVTELEFAAFLDSPVQWVFNKSRIQGLAGPGQYLCVSLSGAQKYGAMSKGELQALFATELARLFPKAREAKIERFIIVKQLAATFRSSPGAEEHRLPQATPVRNLYLAGDWTQTAWPSTMESAVRSGRLAAARVLEGG